MLFPCSTFIPKTGMRIPKTGIVVPETGMGVSKTGASFYCRPTFR